MSIPVEECRRAELRDRAQLQRESARAGGLAAECHALAAEEFDRQAKAYDCECGRCEVDEG